MLVTAARVGWRLTPLTPLTERWLTGFNALAAPAGTYSHQAAGVALHPHEWRSAKHPHSTTPPPGRQKNYPFSDGSFSEDDWDRPAG